MKTTVIGIEHSSGVGGKSGKPFSIGSVYTTANLAPPMNGDSLAKGQMGTTYRCDPLLVRKIAHLSFPLVVELVTEAQIRFGNREEVVVDILPVEISKKSA